MAEQDPRIGKNVNYYLNGWRTGRLDSITGELATIQPIGAHKKTIQIPKTDIGPEIGRKDAGPSGL